MATDHTDKTPRGPLRALADWFRRTPHSHPPTDPSASPREGPPGRENVPDRIGHYVILGKLGQGGMGVVYAARDERLEREVAIKTMSVPGNDEMARARFWREARAAARVNHPNICQIYEIGEHDGELFIAMERLEGEALAERLQRGPLSVSAALPIGLGILAALGSLHARGIIHRDLKPSNVFLTPHGVKLLDFGLARPSLPELERSQVPDLTRTGMVMGTPRYIAPEQVTGQPLDARSDLFAAGAILFEMLAGRPAFEGTNVIAILHATIHEQPPALSGSPAVAAVDRVIRRALAKQPSERPASAEAMADELRAVQGTLGDDTLAALARTLTRLVVLPFRVLRPDPETDFLAFSLPDAIATSLSGTGSLIVRSTTTAARFASDAPDLKAVAAEADVDRVVMGTLLRSGDQLRATAQLVEAPGGTLLTSQTVTTSLGDLFRLQDDIARRVVDALSLPLAAPPSTPHAPQDSRAYGLYLQANALAQSYEQMPQARDLYQASVDLDPSFAPAWAHLGRSLRVIGKFLGGPEDTGTRAEEALRRALELNPRLTVAHKFYANLEADMGQARAAIVRLLGEANRHGNDPELFAGLVHACRYGGLYDESVAAHEEARRLDPHIDTGFEQTLLMKGDVDRLLAVRPPIGAESGGDLSHIIGLGLIGRHDDARRLLSTMRQTTRIPTIQAWGDLLTAWLERRPADMHAIRATIGPVKIMEDPEAIFQEGLFFSDAGDHAHGLAMLRRAVTKGYFPVVTLSRSRAFDGVRTDPAFRQILADATAGREQALAAFKESGGERLLGRYAPN